MNVELSTTNPSSQTFSSSSQNCQGQQSALTNTLPEVLVNVILSYAVRYDTPAFQDTNIFSTCKRFLSREKTFIERFGKEKAVEDIVRTLLREEKMPSLQAFTFPNLQVTRLSLEGNRALSLTEVTMKKIVLCFPDLRELNLKNSFLGLIQGGFTTDEPIYRSLDGYCLEDAPGHALQPLSKLKNLRVLHIDDNKEIVKSLLKRCKSRSSDHFFAPDAFAKLESFSFRNSCNEMRPILHALATYSIMPSLTDLTCSKTKIDEHESDWKNTLMTIERSLGLLGLKRLHLANHTVRPENLKLLLLDARFERLGLVNCSIDGEMLAKLVKISTLQYLDVRNNAKLTAEDIAKAREENPQLTIQA